MQRRPTRPTSTLTLFSLYYTTSNKVHIYVSHRIFSRNRNSHSKQYLHHIINLTNMGQKMTPFVSAVAKFQQFIFLGVGPRVLPMRYQINFFKGTTFLWVLFLMYYFQNYSTGMWLYFCLHGSYGMAWLAKDLTYPDGRFMQKTSIISNIMGFLFLSGYWFIPVPLAAGYGISNPSTGRIIAISSIYLVGLWLMMVSDYQKSKKLKQRPGLISDGLFSYSRNPNYLGQILIYSSFVLCSGHLTGFIMVHGVACLVFAINIYMKDKLSYEKKKGWKEYRKQSYILLPKLMGTLPLNVALYTIVGIVVWVFFAQEAPEKFSNFDFFSNVPQQ